MKLQDLNEIIHSNLLTSSILKTNISSSCRIEETKNIGMENTLQYLTINNMPTSECWLFEHENSEKEFLTSGKKVEKTILFLSKDTKDLFVISIEMKTKFKINQLIDCAEKLNSSLTHLSIFIATNNHLIDIYKDYKIKFRMAIFCYDEMIAPDSPNYSLSLCQNFVSFQNGTTKRFNININSPSLGPMIVPSTRVLEDSEHISIDFYDLLDRLS